MELRKYNEVNERTGKEYPVWEYENIFSAESRRFEKTEDFLKYAEEIATECSEWSGFKITKEAVEWQIENWYCDYKSGYRDDKGGYFLFSPCGCNDFSIRITDLQEGFGWQKTYYA